MLLSCHLFTIPFSRSIQDPPLPFLFAFLDVVYVRVLAHRLVCLVVVNMLPWLLCTNWIEPREKRTFVYIACASRGNDNIIVCC